jgi:N-acetyl-gamma-glutamyl-phosphate reductase
VVKFKMIKVSIIGATGYTGSELLRLLLFHEKVEVVKVTSRSDVEVPVGQIHRNLYKLTNLKFTEEDIEEIVEISDAVFLALPHGQALEKIPAIFQAAKGKPIRVLDLGGDFRLKDTQVFEKYYKLKHTAPEFLKDAVYGLTEFNREGIQKSNLVACPGCFPTGALLALFPLAAENLLTGDVIINSATGSSGSGTDPSEGTHHPERAFDYKAYNVFSHRHQPEIQQELERFNGNPFEVTLTTHSAPMVRGIFTTVFAHLSKEIPESRLKDLYCGYYENEHFIRLVDQPRSAVVAGSNFCDVSVVSRGRKVIINSAIDNLVKGGSGQAVQDMNLMFGLDEKMGLTFPGTHP